MRTVIWTMLLSLLAPASWATEVAHSIPEVHRQFMARLESGDRDGLLQLFESDALFVTATGEEVRGRSAIGEALAPYLGSRVPMQTLSVRIHIRGNLAQVISQWRLGEQEGTALEVLRYSATRGWRYVIDNPHGL